MAKYLISFPSAAMNVPDSEWEAVGRGAHVTVRGARYHGFMGWTMPWYSVLPASVEQLIANRHFGILVA